MARCMTPLIETSSAHRHPSNRETCRNRRLRELLARHVGLSEERFGSRRSMVYRPQKGNSKRHSGFHNIVALAKESQAQLRLVVKLRHGKIIDSFVDTNWPPRRILFKFKHCIFVIQNFLYFLWIFYNLFIRLLLPTQTNSALYFIIFMPNYLLIYKNIY